MGEKKSKPFKIERLDKKIVTTQPLSLRLMEKKKMLTHLLKNAIRDHYLAELIGLIFSRKICRTIKKHL